MAQPSPPRKAGTASVDHEVQPEQALCPGGRPTRLEARRSPGSQPQDKGAMKCIYLCLLRTHHLGPWVKQVP